MESMDKKIQESLAQITDHLENGIIPFWLKNSIDKDHGGFLTCFDTLGERTNDTDKYIVTQTRMIWGLSALFKL